MFFSRISYVKSAASTMLLLALGLCMGGCRSSLPDPRAFQTNTPSLDASTLSGGKITDFVPVPGLGNDSDNATLLTAAGLSDIKKGAIARKGFVTFQSQTGNDLVGCLVIGNDVLVVLGDFTRQAFGRGYVSAGLGGSESVHGPPYNGKPFLETKPGRLFLYADSQQYIEITPNEKVALVGGKRVKLDHPMTTNGVIFLSDLLRLWRERDKQMGSGTSVRNVKIIYDLKDYHR